MVVASLNGFRNEKILAIDLPMIDLSAERSETAKLIVKACEDYGFFKVINHGVPEGVIAKMEQESACFFSKPVAEKQQAQAAPANPFGYGCKNIGFNGDLGEVEYLLLNSNPQSIDQTSNSISSNPSKFSSAVKDYIKAVKELAYEILDLMAEGLWIQDGSYFSKMIRDVENDSFFRINHYPPCYNNSTASSVGFGEHTDPQILTILRSNDVGGLQISPDHGVWIPVAPDPATFCVNVGDLLQNFAFGFDETAGLTYQSRYIFLPHLQASTDGRFVSVRHRVLSNTSKSRMSMAYFGAPALQARISAPPALLTTNRPSLYRPFTWAEYKEAVYSLRLGDSRLDLFRNCRDNDHKVA